MTNRTVAVELKALISSYVANMKQAATATKDFAAKGAKYIEDHSAELNQLSNQAALTGAAITLGVGKAVKTYADFDKEMSRVRSTGDDARQSIDGLRETAVKLGADTQYSAQEAAQGITDMLKAGMTAEDVIGGGLAGALALAASDQLDVAFAAETTAVALKMFGLEGTRATHVADLLAAGSNAAMGGVTEMAQALKYVGPVAAGMNISIEETIGTLTAFASEGILADQAGTSLRGVLSSLTSPSAAARKEMDRLGISLYDQQGNFLGLANMAGQLEQAYVGATDAEKDMSLGILFGNQQLTAARILLKQGEDGLRNWTAQADQAGFAQRQAAEMTNNFAGDLERLGGSLDTVFIQGGGGANRVLRQMAQGAESVVDWIGELPGPLLEVVTLLTGAGGMATLGVAGVLKLAGAAGDAHRNFKALGISAKTAKLAVAGIGGAIALGTLALSAWATAQAEARQRAEDFATTLVVVDGKATLTSSTFSEMIEQLNETKTGFMGWGPSLLELMNLIGVSADDAQGYIAGNEDAIKRVQAATEDYIAVQVRGGMAYDGALQDAQALTGGLDSLQGSLGASIRATEQKSDADQQGDTAAKSYGEALQQQKAAVDGSTDSTVANANAVEELIKVQWAAADAALALSGSQVGFERMLDTTAAAMKKLVKETKDKTDLTNIDTKAGQDAKDILDQNTASTLARVKAMQKAGESEKKIAAEMERGRKALVDQARQAGFSENAIARLVDQYDLLPENVTTRVDETGASEAEERVDALFAAIKELPKDKQSEIRTTFNDKGLKAAEAALDKLKPKTVDVTVRYISKEYGSKPGAADGGLFASGLAGIVRQFAGGGFGQPQVRPFQGAAGVNWGEQGSGPWEAFISGAPQKRERSVAIWREVGRRLLGSYSAEDVIGMFADGGIAEPTHKGRTLSEWGDELRTPLELTRLQIRIRDLKADLAAKETYYTGKGKAKKKRTRLKLRDLDRTEARQELAEAQAEYKLAVEAKKLNASKKGSIEAQIAAWEAENEKAIAAARAEEERAQEAQREQERIQSSATAASDRLRSQYMTGSSFEDLVHNMTAGAQQIADFQNSLARLSNQGMDSDMVDWLSSNGSASLLDDILRRGKAGVDILNAASSNLSLAADALGMSQATGSYQTAPVLERVDVPGYMTSGPNGAAVGNKTVVFNVQQLDPYGAAVYFDQQLRYL